MTCASTIGELVHAMIVSSCVMCSVLVIDILVSRVDLLLSISFVWTLQPVRSKRISCSFLCRLGATDQPQHPAGPADEASVGKQATDWTQGDARTQNDAKEMKRTPSWRVLIQDMVRFSRLFLLSQKQQRTKTKLKMMKPATGVTHLEVCVVGVVVVLTAHMR